MWCEQCYALVTAPMRERVATPDGLNPFAGICRGPGYWDAELHVYAKHCDTCKAGTWSVHDGDEHCWHCHRAYLRVIDDRRDQAATPPDIDPDDATYEAVVGAWIDRLTIAVEAGLITTTQARIAWERANRGRHGTAA